MYLLIISLLTGHMQVCKHHDADPDSKQGVMVFGPGSFDYADEPCESGFKVTGTSFTSYDRSSKEECEAAGRAWINQHKGLVGIKATFSCTPEKG